MFSWCTLLQIVNISSTHHLVGDAWAGEVGGDHGAEDDGVADGRADGQPPLVHARNEHLVLALVADAGQQEDHQAESL